MLCGTAARPAHRFQKLRYTVEYFREVLGERAEMVIEEIKPSRIAQI
jgi:CHAD domain-containing protein